MIALLLYISVPPVQVNVSNCQKFRHLIGGERLLELHRGRRGFIGRGSWGGGIIFNLQQQSKFVTPHRSHVEAPPRTGSKSLVAHLGTGGCGGVDEGVGVGGGVVDGPVGVALERDGLPVRHVRTRRRPLPALRPLAPCKVSVG